MAENWLKAKGIAYEVGKFPWLANGRARAMGEVDGFVKVLADTETDLLLGLHIIGPRASDLIAEAALAIELERSAVSSARRSASRTGAQRRVTASAQASPFARVTNAARRRASCPLIGIRTDSSTTYGEENAVASSIGSRTARADPCSR